MTTQRLCSTIGCTSTATHLLTYSFPESRDEKEMDHVCRICGIGYTHRVSLRATLVEFTTEPKLDSWTVYASSGEYHVAARTLAEVANTFTADHPDDSMLAITCDAMEPALKLADESATLKLADEPAPLPDWCETCGNEVRHGVCNCWMSVADALEQYMGYDLDSAADAAKTLWDDLDIDVRREVWAAVYADDHDVMTYPKPASSRPAHGVFGYDPAFYQERTEHWDAPRRNRQ